MATANSRAIVILMLACILADVCPRVASTITCSRVFGALSGCIDYTRNGGVPPPACCSGVRGLNSAARATADRQQACVCIQSLLKAIPGVREDLANKVPGICGVNVGYRISQSIDCSKVK